MSRPSLTREYGWRNDSRGTQGPDGSRLTIARDAQPTPRNMAYCDTASWRGSMKMRPPLERSGCHGPRGGLENALSSEAARPNLDWNADIGDRALLTLRPGQSRALWRQRHRESGLKSPPVYGHDLLLLPTCTEYHVQTTIPSQPPLVAQRDQLNRDVEQMPLTSLGIRPKILSRA